MKVIRNIIFIPIIFLIVALVYTLLPMSLFALLGLSNFWQIVLLVFFGGFAALIFPFLPGAITWVSAKISPNKEFAYYSTLTISVLLGTAQIYGYWTNPDFIENGLGTFLGLMLTFLTIGLATSLSAGSGIEIFEKNNSSLGIILSIGLIVFYIGIFLAFCLLSTNICYINPDRTYTWYSGIWHGAFVIPKWVVSWFSDNIRFKATNSTTAYGIWWWISFIFVGLGVLGSGSRLRDY